MAIAMAMAKAFYDYLPFLLRFIWDMYGICTGYVQERHSAQDILNLVEYYVIGTKL
jgi:hypothetical protein